MNNIFSDSLDMSSQRSLLRALGWTDDEMKKPLVGIICAQSEIIPGHTHLSEVARAAAEGVIDGTSAASGTEGRSRWAPYQTI